MAGTSKLPIASALGTNICSSEGGGGMQGGSMEKGDFSCPSDDHVEPLEDEEMQDINTLDEVSLKGGFP